jgi:vancomycin permeability regulator SanA
MAKKNGFFTKQFFRIFLLEFLGLALLLLIKYHNQGISVLLFRWQYTGNLINLITTGLAVLSLLFIRIQSPAVSSAFNRIFTRLLVTGLIGLIAGKLLILFPVPFPTFYLLEQPVKRLFVGLCFSLYQVTQMMLIVYCWLGIFGGMGKYLFRAFLHSCLLTVLGISAIFIYDMQWRSANIDAEDGQYQIGVVFGAAVWSQNRPSPILVSRLQKTIELYLSKKIEKIQVTGSNAPGEKTEAEVSHDYLRSYGLPETDILVENKTTSTTEQVRYIKNVLIKQHGNEEIAVISDTYHLPRIDEIAKFYDLKLRTYGAEIKLSFHAGFVYRLRESFALMLFWLFGI